MVVMTTTATVMVVEAQMAVSKYSLTFIFIALIAFYSGNEYGLSHGLLQGDSYGYEFGRFVQYLVDHGGSYTINGVKQ